MALHTELQIYRPAYDLLNLVTDIARHIPRDFKQLIGEKLRDECIEIVTLILRANTAKDKAPHHNPGLRSIRNGQQLFWSIAHGIT